MLAMVMIPLRVILIRPNQEVASLGNPNSM